MTKFRIFLGWSTIALVALIVVLNLQLVDFGMFGLELRLPLSLLLVGAVGLGMVVRPVARRVIGLIKSTETTNRR